jgi:hypothetical protein
MGGRSRKMSRFTATRGAAACGITLPTAQVLRGAGQRCLDVVFVTAGGLIANSVQTIGSMPSRSLRRPHISLMIVTITPGVLSVDSPLVRGK